MSSTMGPIDRITETINREIKDLDLEDALAVAEEVQAQVESIVEGLESDIENQDDDSDEEDEDL